MRELRHVSRLQASRRGLRRGSAGAPGVSRTYVFARSAPSAEYDRSLAWAALLLAALGLVMVYSASIATAEASRFTGHNAAWYLARHGLFLGAALAAALTVFLAPVKLWQGAAPWLFAAGVAPLARHPAGERAALGTRQARRRALRGRLHGAQARGDEELQEGTAADARGHAARLVAPAARAGLRRAGRDHGQHIRDFVSRRHERAPFHGAPRDARHRLRGADRFLALPHAAHLRLHGPVVRRFRQGLPAVPLADRLRPRRMARRGPRCEPREAALSSGGDQRVPARRHRRGVRIAGAPARHRAVHVHRGPRLRHRKAGDASSAPLRCARRPGHRRLDRLPGPDQHGGERGVAADQGTHAAAHELRRLGPGRELRGARHPAAHRLGKPAARPGLAGVKTILIMAGGTGGHIFPGLAVAHEMRAAGWEVVWMGARGGMEERLVPPRGYRTAWIRAKAARGKGLLQKLLLPANLLYSFWESARLIRRLKPDVVLGLGGYVAFPGGMMASLLNRPLALHEQNAVPGLANRVLSTVCDKVMVAFPRALGSAEWTGNPVRDEIAALAPPEDRFRARTGRLRILVVGGS